MSADDKERGLEGDEALAAEYVTGVLDAAERQAVARRLETDAGFARLVDQWEARLAPMAAHYAPVEPPPSVKQGIDRRLGLAQPPARPKTGLWANLGLWRGMSFGAVTALVVAIAVPLMTPPKSPMPKYVASLTSAETDMRFMAMYDDRSGMLSVKLMDGRQPTDRDLELWVMEKDKAPVSMGVLPAGAASMPVPMPMRPMLKPGLMLAVSVEPMGGSQTGAPTGPMVAKGDLRSV